MSMLEVLAAGHRMAAILALTGSPIGVCLLAPGQPQPEGELPHRQHRYCQALRKARGV